MGNLTSTQKNDMGAMLSAALFGVIMFILSIMAHKQVPENCDKKQVRSCITAILALSAGLITIAITYFACMQGAKCFGGESNERTAEWYFSIAGAISLAIIICSIIILVENNNQCGGSNLSRIVIAMLVLSSLMLIGSGWGGYVAAYGIPRWMKYRKGQRSGSKKIERKEAETPFGSNGIFGKNATK